jgi:putative phage-type endonuclease
MIGQQTLSHYGIGASDIAAVCGLNPYRAPIEVWREKVGLSERFAGNEATRWGQALEPLIREEYRLRNGVIMITPETSLFSKSTPWARCTPDGIVIKELGGRGEWDYLVQVKTVGPLSIRRWEDGKFPHEYEAQVQWEMFVTDLPRCDVAVLLGGQQYEERRVERNNDVIESLVEMASEFWGWVETKTEPPPDESEAYARHLADKLKRNRTDTIILNNTEASMLAKMLREQRATAKAIESEITGIENHIKAIMAEKGAEAIQTGEGLITWKAAKDTLRTDWRALAEELLPLETELASALITKHSKPVEGSRRFLVPRTWGGE